MQITLSTASATLESLIGASGVVQANAARPQSQPYYNVTIANPGAIAIYFEMGANATTSGSIYVPVASGSTPGYAFIKTDNLAKVNLIAASGTPTANVTFG